MVKPYGTTGVRCWAAILVITAVCWIIAGYAAYQCGMLDGIIVS